MTIVITGATGQLGRLVVDGLLDHGVPGENIVATGRAVERLQHLTDRGVAVRAVDYAEPATLDAAFAGAERVLFISGSEAGQRIPQHRNVIDAARRAGVGQLAYTGIANVDTSKMLLANEHRTTEQLIRESGLPFTFLRNSWYTENYLAQLPTYLATGAILGSAGEGRVSAATRAEYAAAAVQVLRTDGHLGRAYELGGDTAFTLAELAATVSAAAGRPVAYRELPEAELVAALTEAGVPAAFAAVLADSDRGIARGELEVAGHDLSDLIGGPTRDLAALVAEALAAQPAH
jgi:NAD(P)H dehydrogenase (quinone)